jgi:hypothetical protein
MELVKGKTMPTRLFFGGALVAIFWFASWTHLGVLGEYAFFPLWLGYILIVDALVEMRRGASLLTRSFGEFIALFLLSAPAWWVFEFHNYFLLNWHYLSTSEPSFWQMLLVGTIDFSTVIPAVFETRELTGTFAFVERFRTRKQFHITRAHLWATMYGAVILFAGIVLLPRYFFAFTWIWLFLFVDALNFLRGRASLIAQAARGDWRNGIALGLGALVCGFFWEMWNFFAMPKWFYTVPFVGFAKIFEMPILGYGGYLPFAWELYALYHFVWGKLNRPTLALNFDRQE